jgi:hypothetical protein
MLKVNNNLRGLGIGDWGLGIGDWEEAKNREQKNQLCN